MSELSLIDAVEQGDVSKVNELINAGAEVNAPGDRQEWTALNFAAGNGDLAMVKLLVESGGADVFQTGRDNRTPYKIALAAGRDEVARYLADAEERAGGDEAKTSSREGETRPFCKAYPLAELRQFPEWAESKEGEELSDEDIVFIHRDFTVTRSMFHEEDVLMDGVTSEWQTFCTDVLDFKVPDDFDLIPSNG